MKDNNITTDGGNNKMKMSLARKIELIVGIISVIFFVYVCASWLDVVIHNGGYTEATFANWNLFYILFGR